MFTKITNQLYYGFNGDNQQSILKIVKDEKVLLVLDYLYMNRTQNNISLFSLDDMVYYCGYIPKTGIEKKTGKIYTNNQFENILSTLEQIGVIKILHNNTKYKLIERCEILTDLSSKFFTLDEQIKNKILQCKPNGKKVDNTKLLLFYCYILSRIFTRSNNDKDINVHGGKTEVCYPSYDTIRNAINISQDSINKYNKILIDLDLIRIANAGRFYYKDDRKKQIHESANTYALYNENGEHDIHLEKAINAYKLDANRVFIDKERCDREIRRINGFIGNVKKLERLGIAKPEHIKKRDMLVKQQEKSKRNKIDSS